MTLHLEVLNDYVLAIVNRKLTLHNVTRTISVACEELLVNLTGEQPHLMGGGSGASVTTHDRS